ncbi:MAG: hypothetical protein U5J83_01915 [Bryobacterales bacterium]|nr:hypothetical protein [Bryobacterales bacterium]
MPSPPLPLALFADFSIPPIRFGAGAVLRAQQRRGGVAGEHSLAALPSSAAPMRIAVAATPGESARLAASLGVSAPASDASQAYSIRRATAQGITTVAVLGADAAAAMYGLLDLAEALEIGSFDTLADRDARPHLERRGIKFNIPLDARTPSYSDNSDASQGNIPEMWSFDFWREFLDEMATHRYNVLTLWSLHPFPSIVRVPEYPDVALNDVMRTTLAMNETFSHNGDDMVRPAMLERLETVRHIGIDEKIAFWRDVMQYAKDRAIEVYWFTWNIFAFGAEGKYGITPEQDNPATIAYFRASVRELVLTYPLLAGIGITSGEQMENRKDEFSKEKWLWATYGQGILDAKKIDPQRKVRLIHRYHQTSQTEILDEWKAYPDTFELSFKYAIAHMYSIPNPPFVHDALKAMPAGRKMWLTVRNDDVYSFRWADPDYARAFIESIPEPERIAGYYMGPDGYCWGREFLSLSPQSPRESVIRKQWFSFLLWGRLSFSPKLGNAHFERILAARFPQVDAANLLETWAAASQVFPLITRFFWGDIDLRWFPEACLSHPRVKHFYNVYDFADGITMPGSNVLNVRQWRLTELAGGKHQGVTPPQIANALGDAALKALGYVELLHPKAAANKELKATLLDIEAMAFLAHYYAAKIRAACELALFDQSKEPARQASAIRLLHEARGHWQRYATVYTRQYLQPRLYNRVGFVDLPSFLRFVEQDIEIARDWKPGSLPDDPSNIRRGDRPFVN